MKVNELPIVISVNKWLKLNITRGGRGDWVFCFFLLFFFPIFVLAVLSSKSNILNFFFQVEVYLKNKNYERLTTVLFFFI